MDGEQAMDGDSKVPTELQGKTQKQILLEVWCAVEGINTKLDKLDVTVRGNRDYNSPGLVTEIAELKARVAALEKFRDRAIWISIGLGAASGGGIGLLIQKIVGG